MARGYRRNPLQRIEKLATALFCVNSETVREKGSTPDASTPLDSSGCGMGRTTCQQRLET